MHPRRELALKLQDKLAAIVGSPKLEANKTKSDATIEAEAQALKAMFKEFDANGDGMIRSAAQTLAAHMN